MRTDLLRAARRAISTFGRPRKSETELGSAQRMSETERKYRDLVERLPAIVYTCVPTDNGDWLYISPQVESLLGVTPEEVKTNGLWNTQLHPDDAERVRAEEALSRDCGEAFRSIYRLFARDGRLVWVYDEAHMVRDGDGGPLLLQGVISDITEQKLLEERLEHLAFHDGLTNLPNRALFSDRVQHALARSDRDGDSASVLFMDLDDFKTVNDSLGHASGDELIGQVAGRLTACLREADTPARLGGDEFAVLLEQTDARRAVSVAEKIIAALHPPFPLQGKDISIHASIGIAVSTEAHSTDELLRDADVAMYQAKSHGKDCYRLFKPEMHTAVLERLELTSRLKQAVDGEQLTVEYQPVVELASGAMIGVEALVRWKDPVSGTTSPAHFIPLAEESGLILKIDRWVLSAACTQVALWQSRHHSHKDLHVCVNLSGRSLQEPTIVDEVTCALDDSGLDPRSLVLEITERFLMQDADLACTVLTGLKRLGVKLAVDDFGTGYSSLSRLRGFPVDILKIDRSFVDQVSGGAQDGELVRAIVKLGESLKLETIAEGIEHPEQVDHLTRFGCRLGQGYHFSRPLSEARLEQRLSASSGAPYISSRPDLDHPLGTVGSGAEHGSAKGCRRSLPLSDIGAIRSHSSQGVSPIPEPIEPFRRYR